MEYLGIILFLWILGGTGVFAKWAESVVERDTTGVLFRSPADRQARSPSNLNA